MAATLVAAATACADVLLLRTGAIVEGRAESVGDDVVIHHGDGALRMPADSIAVIVDSRLEAYDWLRSREITATPRVGEHLRLADWAIRNQLWPQAARELLEARQLAPRHARLELLERRLAELSRPPRPVASTPKTPEPTSASEAVPAEEPVALPAEGLEHFTRRIQPLLLNGCANAGCHRGEPGDAFPLDPSSLYGYGNTRTTDRNLKTALGALDLENPARSPLLIAARGVHAGVNPLEGHRREELLERLARWAERVAAANRETPPPSNEADEAVAEASVATAAVVDETPAGESAAEASATIEPPEPRAPQRGVNLTRVEPRDEFDPEIFNRRFRRPEDDAPSPGVE